MSNEIETTPRPPLSEAIEKVLIAGDLAPLTSEQRVAYYHEVCQSVGLNPLTRPFDYLTFQGKTQLYVKAAATDQLRRLHGVAITLPKKELLGDIYMVTAQAQMPDGRVDESTGALSVAGLKGEALATAYMKCEAKAKRRVTLSICGLGLLDQGEVEPPRQPAVVVEPLPKAAPQPEPVAAPAEPTANVIDAVVIETKDTQPADPEKPDWFARLKATEWKKQIAPLKLEVKEWHTKAGIAIPKALIEEFGKREKELP